MVREFINLTNGIEHIPNVVNKHWDVVRITSTSIEKQDWCELLSLDHNLLFWLARGETCIIYDCGCRREVTKVVSCGIPIIRQTLEYCWFNQWPTLPVCQKIASDILERADNEVKQSVKRRLTHYRKWLGRERTVSLVGVSKSTTHDGDVGFYRSVLESNGV